MQLLFILSGEIENLPVSEILAQIDSKSYNLYGRHLIVETDDMDEKDIELLSLRLSFTHSIHKLLFKTNKKDLNKEFKKFDWKAEYKKNF